MKELEWFRLQLAIDISHYFAGFSPENKAIDDQPESTPFESEKPPVLTLKGHFFKPSFSGIEEDKLRKLFLESRELACKFHKLCTNLYFSLKLKADSKEDVVACLMGLDAYEPVFNKSANQPVFGEQKAKLFEATTLHKVWCIISHYHSFFNYYIVEHLIQYLGTDEDKQNMSSYKQSFAEYAKRRVYECPTEFGYENEGDCTIIVKLDEHYDNCTLRQLELFKKSLCELLKLSREALRLCRVEQGCYELTLQSPAFVREIVFPLSSEQEKALTELNVVWLLCGDYEFSSHQSNVRDCL